MTAARIQPGETAIIAKGARVFDARTGSQKTTATTRLEPRGVSARQLAEIVRVIARDRGVVVAAVTFSFDEDRDSVRFVVCAPCATSEREFGEIVGRSAVGELNKKADLEVQKKIVRWLRERTTDAERALSASNDPEGRRLGTALRSHNLVLADEIERGAFDT